jgi:hypothetical protein
MYTLTVNFSLVRFDVLRVMTIQNTILWDVTPCSLVEVNFYSSLCLIILFNHL